MSELWEHTTSGTLKGATRDKFLRSITNGLETLGFRPRSTDPVRKFMSPKIKAWDKIYDEIMSNKSWAAKPWTIPQEELDKLPLRYQKWILNGKERR